MDTEGINFINLCWMFVNIYISCFIVVLEISVDFDLRKGLHTHTHTYISIYIRVLKYSFADDREAVQR